jgi:hypothetical protein
MNRECCTEIAAEFARLKVDVIVGDRCCQCGKEGNVSHAMVRQKESRPRAAPCLLPEGSSARGSVSRHPRVGRRPSIAGDIMRGALRLVDFAFRLQLLVAGYLAG